MRSIFSLLIAIMVGVIILLGYFITSPVLNSLRTPLLSWAIILSGTAGLVAIINLIFGVHWKRLRESGNKRIFSAVVIVAFLCTLATGFYFGPTDPGYQKVVTSIQVPIETSLMAVMAVTMAYSSLRLLQRQKNWMGIIFFISVILFLIINSGILSFTAEIPVLQDLLSGFHKLPAAGARGILIGVALGSIATGIRILIGSDRPYSG